MAKSGGPRSVKKKATARKNAQDRAQRQSKRADVPRQVSDQQVSQGRFPGETPLTGEDRRMDRPGEKQHGYRQDLQPERTKANRDTAPSFRAPPVKRRPNRASGETRR
jgi:hypothetical protein